MGRVAFDVWWADAWLEPADEPRGAAVCLGHAESVKEAEHVAFCFAMSAGLRHGAGVVVVLDRAGRRHGKMFEALPGRRRA